MPALSDYTAGTITLTNNSTAFTGSGTGWQAADFREGDVIFQVEGQTQWTAVVQSITSNTAGTLVRPWGGATGTYQYRMRYMADGARVTAQARNLIELLGNGNLQAEAGLVGAADMLSYYTGPAAKALTSLTTFARTLLDDADAAAARATLGAGTGDFVGPNGGVVDGELIAFNGTTGKAGKGTGLLPQASTLDAATNRLMRVGAFGLGATGVNLNPPGDNLNTLRTNGTYRCTGATVGTPFGSFIGQVTHAGQSGDYATQFGLSSQTSAVYFRRLNNNVWSSWREIYHQDNLIGTVSQSSGVPTGAIIERGSNANGDYVRFADGTQIGWRTITTPHPNGTLVSGVYVSDFVDTPMPATFVSVPVGGAFFLNTGFSFWMTGGPLNSNTWRTRALGMTAWTAGGVGSTFLFAIGRWF